jgi:serine O-acetyltransferase
MLIYLYRISNFFYRKNIPVLSICISKVIYVLQYFLCNSSVPASVKIGKGTKFGYGGIGVVIHARAIIGKNCILGQNITIGGKSKHYEVPKIGDNVFIAPGSRILGPIIIGNDVIIGANAVVIKDVPSNTVVAGVPAKIIKTGIKKEDYV